ncbi:hypothetical protein [Promicromonospora soli]
MVDGPSDSKTPIWVAVIAAGGTVLAAVVGLFSGVVEVPVLTGQPGSSELQRTVQALEDQVSRLEERNRELENQLNAAPSPTATSDSVEPGSEVLRQTEASIRLSNYSCLDLDSQAPDWDTNDDYSGDLCFGAGLVESDNITVFDDAPSLDVCAARTQKVDSVDADSLLGKFLCVESSSGRTAQVHIPAVNATGGSDATIDFELVVWN